MRGRGIDFEQRFRTSRWAEDLLIAALGGAHGLLTVRFGLSEVRRDNMINEERTDYKDPDLLTYDVSVLTVAERRTLEATDLVRQPRSAFDPGNPLGLVLGRALAALEVEFSPYKAAEMKDRHWKPKTLEQWNRRPLNTPDRQRLQIFSLRKKTFRS